MFLKYFVWTLAFVGICRAVAMEYRIETQWDSSPIDHDPIVLKLSSADDSSLLLEISAPFFNDPPSPPVAGGQPLYKLWEYEVVELMLLNEDKQYLEINLCPWGQYLTLLLNGVRNEVQHSLPLNLTVQQRNESNWTGSVRIPLGYLPPNVTKMNAYAIHGSGDKRVYEALYPVPKGMFHEADFHRLEYFQPVDLSQLVPVPDLQKLSSTWSNTLKGGTSILKRSSYEYAITKTWDNKTIDHDEIRIKLEHVDGTEILVHVEAPFFNDPAEPAGLAGEPFYGLWEYEVVELFLANDDNRYFEIELNPWGQHIVLLLNGIRQTVRHSLPLEFTSNITKSHWSGTARIPVEYLPPNVTKLNAYAIHGTGGKRVYESLYPVPAGLFSQPDFHRLEFFQPINISGLIDSSYMNMFSQTWNEALNGIRNFAISQTWDGVPLHGTRPRLELKPNKNGDLVITVSAPFYDDPAPAGQPGSLYGLWDYEVVELFLANDKNEYIEIELGPWGHYLILLLKGYRNTLQHSLILPNYEATRSTISWTGTAVIPSAYLPPKVTKMNAYAIHGTGNNRTYSSLYPADHAVFDPDFHLLRFFKHVDLDVLLMGNAKPQYSSTWAPFEMQYAITSTWDNQPISHGPIEFNLSSYDGGIQVVVEAPFFDNKPPNGPAGEPFYGLWDYEVFEIFFTNDADQYLEVELCPHGQHIVLFLDGVRQTVRHSVPLDFKSQINGTRWSGTAKIPSSYLPPQVTKMNAYAIHSSGSRRVYKALYPVPYGKYPAADFHKLQYFKEINLTNLVEGGVPEELSPIWQESLAGRRSYSITKLWNGLPVTGSPTNLELRSDSTGNLHISISAPFYNDPSPSGEPGEAFYGLWDYEVVELFLANAKGEYVEIELGPWGHHLVLLLKGYRNMLNHSYPIEYTTEREDTEWIGNAIIPSAYLPPKVTRMNAYAINGVGDARRYLSLYPVDNSSITQPDFHLLQYFKVVDLDVLIPNNARPAYSPIWISALNIEFMIRTTWDNRSIDHDPVIIRMKQAFGSAIILEVDAPFFNDPPAPNGTVGEPFFGLWDYEVVELFFANDQDQYVEIELCPWGQHIVLLLNGTRRTIRHSLPLEFVAERNGTRWIGSAYVPTSYLPKSVTRVNAYAIHGSGAARTYESLYPVPQGQFQNPDFHRLEFFKPMDLSRLVSQSILDTESSLWKESLLRSRSMGIRKLWNGLPSGEVATVIEIKPTAAGDLHISLTAPFYNDSPPDVPGGRSLELVTDYEVVELFLANEKKEYIEIALGPWQHHSVVFFSGYRDKLKGGYPVQFSVERRQNSWDGQAIIPASYLPPKISKVNAHSAHGNGTNRKVLSLYPVPRDANLTSPDLHLLQYFKAIDMELVIDDNDKPEYSDVWKEALGIAGTTTTSISTSTPKPNHAASHRYSLFIAVIAICVSLFWSFQVLHSL